MSATRITSVLRHWLWRVVCGVSGGLTVTGRWQVPGGCVVVANHASHADTAVLLAALPAKAQPVFAAAADSETAMNIAHFPGPTFEWAMVSPLCA